MLTNLTAHIAQSHARSLVPALGCVLVHPDGHIETTQVGHLRASGTDLVSPHSFWHIGSCTKAMTATLFARLVDQGHIDFDTKLGEVFGKQALWIHPDFRQTPVSALLRHEAGIMRDPSKRILSAMERSNVPATTQRWIIALEALKTAPRPIFEYSNVGYIIAGTIIEKLIGTRWETALASEVMTPLNINHYGFGPPPTGEPSGHRKTEAGWRPENSDNPKAYGPAGTIHLALEEWGKFLRVHAQNTPLNFLSNAAFHHLHRPNMNGFAMGWFVNNQPQKGAIHLTHTGSNTAWYARATLIPQHGVGIGIVCNAYDASVSAAVDALANELLELRSNKAD